MFVENKKVIILSLITLLISAQYFTDFLSILTSIGEEQVNTTCPSGTFMIGNMTTCHPWLKCPEIKDVLVISNQEIGNGAQKIVKKSLWHQNEVAVSILRHIEYLDDFKHGLAMLHLFNSNSQFPTNKFVQLVGWCFENTPVIITELHPFGDASNIHSIISKYFLQLDSLSLRLGLCISFVQILDFLHSHPSGTRVMCDANTPEKALSQLLVTTNLTFILNDMDALPKVDKVSGQLIKCGHRELQGDFVAPEQRWSSGEEYNDDKMHHYDEKVDIWKIPDVCNYIMGDILGANKLKLHLFNLHSQCKKIDPEKRPNAHDVIKGYKLVYQKLDL